jgi:hypothetical protein
MKIYISSSWKNRDQVRELAHRLRAHRHEVYDFTDPSCRNTPEIPPEAFPEQFDPAVHDYAKYMQNPYWIQAVQDNRKALEWCDAVILLLPCGNDAHADWALGVGLGKRSIVVGQPHKGERSPVHHWADAILRTLDDAVEWVDGHREGRDDMHAL